MHASSGDSRKEGFNRLKLLPVIKINIFHILENEENFNTFSCISIYFCLEVFFCEFPWNFTKTLQLEENNIPTQNKKSCYFINNLKSSNNICISSVFVFSLCKECRVKTFERNAHTISFFKILILRWSGEGTTEKVKFLVKLHIGMTASLQNACTVLSKISLNWQVRKQIYRGIRKWYSTLRICHSQYWKRCYSWYNGLSILLKCITSVSWNMFLQLIKLKIGFIFAAYLQESFRLWE